VLDGKPQDTWARRELVWAIYDARVKPAAAKGELDRCLVAATEIVKLQPDDLPLRRTVFTVCKVAKSRGKWDIVSHWCDRLDPENLDGQTPVIDGKMGTSEREQWYYNKVHSLIELERWEQARALAQRATEVAPRKLDFGRWAALALAELGDVSGAISELEAILPRVRGEWYLQASLADLYLRAERCSEALRLACQAAQAPAEDKARVRVFSTLAELGLRTGNLSLALRHMALFKGIYAREGWPIKPAIADLEVRIRDALGSEADSIVQVSRADVAMLLRLCRQDWREHEHAGRERKTGVVRSVPPERSHAWITADDGQRVFVSRKDLPRTAACVGARVSFVLVPSWDASKNQPSVQAKSVIHFTES
jgi:tetratricopeptide (TPR) repeat protein